MDSKEKDLAEKITDGINPFSFDKKSFIDAMSWQHRTLQQKFTSLCLAWITYVGGADYRTDGRNEYSHEQCAKIVKLMKENDIDDYMPSI
jgi:hypothetical protein